MTHVTLRQLWDTHADLLAVLSVGSIVMLVGSLLLVPWLVLRAPADVFVREEPRVRYGHATGIAVFVVRNALGTVLLFAGILMLLLPGQGLLTIVCALCLMDLPRKRALLRRVVARPAMWKTLAWIRTRAGKAPFEQP